MASPPPQSEVPQWLLPHGVTRGLWDYAQEPYIAEDYDAYFAANSLFQFDQALLDRHFGTPGRLVDLGCGTGRLLLHFVRRGFRGLGVDLSIPMLRVVGRKAAGDGLAVDRLRANLVELDCLRDRCADYCICMFSTLGMIRGRHERRRVLAHARRILRPDGRFALHVHNRWYNLFDPQGRVWLLANWFRSIARRDQEQGDKFFDYRGIPNMFLHVFTRGELAADLKSAGFKPVEWVLLDTERRHALRCPWWLGRLRANGWIVVCR